MNALRSLCVVALLVAAVGASSDNQSLKPSQWFSPRELQELPSIEEMSLEQLEAMPLDKGAQLLETMYQLSQIDGSLKPAFVPSLSNIAVTFIKPNGQKVMTTMDKLSTTCKEMPNFGEEEVTIFMTGLPSTSETVKKANHKLVHAYLQRYNAERPKFQPLALGSHESDSSEKWNSPRETTGNLVIIDLGEKLNNFKRYAMLDIENTGAMIGEELVKMTEKCNVPHEIIHIVAQNIAAHVAGAAGNEFTRKTGHQLRRITALDPSKLFAKKDEHIAGLSRGDAEFVDAIHTSVYGIGTRARVGDIDFFPNGPSAGVPGALNVIHACMRATRYFAESVRPGNERNFPAVRANSMKEYQNNNGFGKRTHMGIDTDFDLEGDYILEVNEKSPFGKRSRAQRQISYHGPQRHMQQEQ